MFSFNNLRWKTTETEKKTSQQWTWNEMTLYWGLHGAHLPQVELLPPASSHWPKDMAHGPYQHSAHCDPVASALGEPGLMEGSENYKISFKKQLH